MPITKLAQTLGSAVVARATQGASQNFLGAPWVAYAVDTTPMWARERVALRFLSLSPHYFYSRNIRAEDQRNRRSRQALVNSLIAPHLNQDSRVLDYGCGPGYMASVVAEKAASVDAVDISCGVLACARAINWRRNITYRRPDELSDMTGKVDFAYSFAVAQHLTTKTLLEVLGLLADNLRPRGTLLLHFAVPATGGWRTEDEWTADRSLAGRLKLRYGLNCFGRSVDEMEALVTSCGFTDIATGPVSTEIAYLEDDDIGQQNWLTAQRKSEK